MKGICPNCEAETTIELVKEKTIHTIRGCEISVDSEFYRCDICDEEFENTRGHDSLAIAYREYRRQNDMLQPEEINEWRKSYGLTQRELSELLGWGGATLSRYENGALQEKSHEKILRLVMEPHNLLKMMRESPRAVGDEKRNRLISELHAAEDEACSFEILFEEKFGRYERSEFSGYGKLSVSKLFNVIIYFCKDGPLKTKLNKLLFYADFKHFKEYAISITGCKYVHLQYGPVPDNYEFFTAELQREKGLVTEEVMFEKYSGTKYLSLVEPDLSLFDDTEIKILAEIKEYFKLFNSSEIKNLSHEEKAYKETNDGDFISYVYAKDLQI